jgi:hypothetical protein
VKLLIVAVGQRVPDWAQTAWDDYAKRFPHELKIELKAVKTEPRASKSLEPCMRPSVPALKPPAQGLHASWPWTSAARLDHGGAGAKAENWQLDRATMWRWSLAAPMGWTRPSGRPRMNAFACRT